MAKISLTSLNAADEAGFLTALADVYEHAPWVTQAVSRQRPFATIAALHTVMMTAVRAAPADQQLALIKGHPDLAGKAARASAMTADSKAEQASAGLDRRSARSFASSRFASTSGSRLAIASKCTGGSPPMCSTPIPAVPRLA